MVALIPLRTSCSLLTLLFVVPALFCTHFGNAQLNPVQLASNALNCFDNKIIYQGCHKDYQLDESGHLDVPCEATNQYCHGPCFSETKSLLKCINNLASNFLFNNGATTQIIGKAIDNGCNNYIGQRERGSFIVGNDNNVPSDACGLNLSGSPPKSFKCFTVVLLLLLCSLFLFQQNI